MANVSHRHVHQNAGAPPVFPPYPYPYPYPPYMGMSSMPGAPATHWPYPYPWPAPGPVQGGVQGPGYPQAPSGYPPTPAYGAPPMQAGHGPTPVAGGLGGYPYPYPYPYPGAHMHMSLGDAVLPPVVQSQKMHPGHGQGRGGAGQGRGRGQGWQGGSGGSAGLQQGGHPQQAGAGGGGGPKKEAFPKIASEGAFSCIVCDRGFDTQRDLSAHTAGHTQCESPGCTFAAQRKIVLAHTAKAHGRGAGGVGEGEGGGMRDASGAVQLPPGLLELIPPKYRGAASVGDSAEEVARWRAERRRNYPTEAHGKVKAAQAAAKRERGELQVVEPGLGLGRRGAGKWDDQQSVLAVATPVPGDGSIDHVHAKRPRLEEGTLAQVAAAPALSVAPAHVDLRGTGSAISSAASVAMDVRVEGEDEEEEDGDGGPPEEQSARVDAYASYPAQEPTKAQARALDTRLGMVSDSAVAGVGVGRATAGTQRGVGGGGAAQRAVCRKYLLGGCRAGARCPFQHTSSAPSPAEAMDRSRSGRGMLAKLLDRERLVESSMLLQCIRHIVSRRFWRAEGEAEGEAGAACLPACDGAMGT